MGKSKHEKLASQLRKLTIQIKQHVDKLKDTMEALRFYSMSHLSFCNQNVRQVMILSHCVAIQIFFSSIKKRVSFSELIAYALIDSEEGLARIEKYRKLAFVYCSADDEIDNRLKLFQSEEIANSISYQQLTIQAFHQEGLLINLNANAFSKPIFSTAISQWQESVEHSDKISKSNSLWNYEFSPKENQTVWEAWQIVMRATRQRKYPHRRGLLSIYRQLLEEQFFCGLNISEKTQQAYINKFKAKIFKQFPALKKRRPGRWSDCQSISFEDAGLFIEYFINIFSKNHKLKKYGEITCILWIMIYVTKEKPKLVCEKDILALTVEDIDNVKCTIKLSGKKNLIPLRLINMLHCLCGKAPLKSLLFQNISLKTLRSELAKASKEILTNGMVVMPSAFLSPFHSLQGCRIEQSEREAMLRARKMIKHLWTKQQILKELTKAIAI